MPILCLKTAFLVLFFVKYKFETESLFKNKKKTKKMQQTDFIPAQIDTNRS